MKKLSVCIPTYGPTDSLERCVESVRNYTEYKDYELLIVDDGTKDKAAHRYIRRNCDRYELLPKNYGNANARNTLIKMAEGEYIAQLDSDTVVTPGWATKLIYALEERWTDPNTQVQVAAALLACQVGYFLSRENPVNEFGLIQVETVGNACTMFRKGLFTIVGTFDAELRNLWSDMDFCKRIHSLPQRFVKTAQVVIDPRVIAYHHGWTDNDGNMVEETEKNTRSLPELNTIVHKKHHLNSMTIIKDRWDIEHDKMAELKSELHKAGAI
ncbi:MAG: glycosyltransferase family 2 protein [Candidatus Thorarchaeota archaeon]|jgi:GT2 family glycosyltransferase